MPSRQRPLSSVPGLASAATLALLKDLMEDGKLIEPLRNCWARFTAVFQIPKSLDTIEKKTAKID